MADSLVSPHPVADEFLLVNDQGPQRLHLFSDLAEAAKAEQAAVFARLCSGPGGLTWTEARRRREQFGPNELASQKPPAWSLVLWHALRHPFNGVLTALAAVSFATGDLKAGIVMLSMIVLSAGLRFWQEMKSQVQAESLRKLVHNETTVLRTENKDVDRKPNQLDRLASDRTSPAPATRRCRSRSPEVPRSLSPVGRQERDCCYLEKGKRLSSASHADTITHQELQAVWRC